MPLQGSIIFPTVLGTAEQGESKGNHRGGAAPPAVPCILQNASQHGFQRLSSINKASAYRQQWPSLDWGPRFKPEPDPALWDSGHDFT